MLQASRAHRSLKLLAAVVSRQQMRKDAESQSTPGSLVY
jgi:hypothetical protein